MVLSNYDMSRKKLTFIKNKELHTFNNIWNDLFKMNEIINKLSLSEEKIIPELQDSKKSGFTYNACRLFTKHCERI